MINKRENVASSIVGTLILGLSTGRFTAQKWHSRWNRSHQIETQIRPLIGSVLAGFGCVGRFVRVGWIGYGSQQWKKNVEK